MCEKVQRLIDESNEELRKKYEKVRDENKKQATEIARLKAELAAAKNHR